MKTIVTILAAAAVMAAAVATATAKKPAKPAGPAKPVSTSKPAAPATSPASATTAPANEAGQEVMATVNGKPIYMAELNEILVYSYGLSVAQQLIANELVNQEAARHKVTVEPKEVQDQHERALVHLFPTMEADQRQKAFEKYLSGQNVTRKQWDFTMQRLALLAKLAELRIKITDEDLQKAFGDVYGRKVVVRHIQVASLAKAQDVLSQLEKGADFIKLAQQVSISPTAASGGLLEPITEATKFPPAIKDAALALTKPGQLSQVVQAGETFHVLRLDQVVLPQNVKFEDVKEKLKVKVHDRRVEVFQQEIMMELIHNAQDKGSVDFANPVLRQQWLNSLKIPDNG